MNDIKRVLITGGAGAFGAHMVEKLWRDTNMERIVIYSRDEHKHERLQHALPPDPDDRLRWFIGDVRDRSRLETALYGIDTIVHAAALKIVPTAEYNPTEAIKTNIIGAMNVVEASLRVPTVRRVIALSTDKACAPVNLYGATKLAAEKTVLAANEYSGGRISYNAVRYGNVAGSTGSVIPKWRALAAHGKPLPVTHKSMTRFWMTLEDAGAFVWQALQKDYSGTVFIPRLRHYYLISLAAAVWREVGVEAGECDVIGMRAGEKLHESLISEDEAHWAEELPWAYTLRPLAAPVKVRAGWSYNSLEGASGNEPMTVPMLQSALKKVR